MSQLEEIKARAEKATPGPWMKDPDEPVHIMKPDKPGFSWDGTVVATLQRDDFGLFEEANADFIAHARTDIPKLLAALEAVEAHHQPIPAGAYDGSKIQICATCSDDTGNWEIYPCPTLTGITEALQ